MLTDSHEVSPLVHPIEVVPDAIIVLDAQQKIVGFNRAAEEITGWRREELLGGSHDILIPERFRAGHAQAVADILAGSITTSPMGTRDGALVALRKNGDEFNAETTISLFETASERFTCVVLRDVAEKLHAQAVLREQQTLLQSFYDTSTFMMGVLELAGETLTVIHVNAAATTFFEERNAAEGDAPSHIRAQWRQRALESQARAMPVRFEYASPRGSETHWIAATVAHLAAAPAGRTRFSFVAEDITERKRTETEQRLLAQTSSTLVRTAMDYETTLREVSRLCVQHLADFCLIALDDEHATSRSIAHRDPAQREMCRALEAHELKLPEEAADAVAEGRGYRLAAVTADSLKLLAAADEPRRLLQALRPVSMIWAPLCARGRRLGVLTLAKIAPSNPYDARDLAHVEAFAQGVGVALDNAQLHAATQRALRARDEALLAAETASRAKSEFLSSMSHELRTPLNSILGFAQLLRRDRLEPLSTRHNVRVASILKSGEHLLRLIEDILDLARIEAGGLLLSPEPVNVADVLREVALTLESDAARVPVTLELSPLGASAAWVIADRTRFTQILINLGSNAIKYNRPGGCVSFSVSHTGGHRVRVSVRDTGIGVSLERQALLFQPFQRAGQENGPIQGTGIGLLITARLARLLGGDVGFQSTANVGSVFWVDLPAFEGLRPSQPPPALTQPVGAAHTGTARKRVLYVEDNPHSLALMRDVFDSLESLELITAATGREGIHRAITERPALILMDLNLPDMTGFEASNVIHAAPDSRAIPIIALTAAATEADRARSKEARFFHYLTKPVRISELERTIEDALAISPSE